jgi:hypothetical protein
MKTNIPLVESGMQTPCVVLKTGLQYIVNDYNKYDVFSGTLSNRNVFPRKQVIYMSLIHDLL